jgi:dCMP deaminase
MRPTRDSINLSIARVVATRSTCLRRSVGCVLTDVSGHILSTGYNGVARGVPHCNDSMVARFHHFTEFTFAVDGLRASGVITKDAQVEPAPEGPYMVSYYPDACRGSNSPSGTNLDGCGAIHAEQNALLQCPDVSLIHTCYCTTAPCVTCTKLLMNTGCQRIIFIEDYPQSGASKDLAERRGILWEQELMV